MLIKSALPWRRRWLNMVSAVVFGREFAEAEIGADLRVRQVAIRPLQVRRILSFSNSLMALSSAVVSSAVQPLLVSARLRPIGPEHQNRP
jgi:hypothetical protein